MGTIAVTLFFTSLLLHELGHATQARREGMEIAGITLWLFGGIAQFKGRFPSAGAEFRIAIAGPIVTLVIGTVLLAAALLIPLPSAVDGVAFWLGYVNLFLLVFNMLPALPLDGGRVLRSALWSRRGNFLSATRTAAAIGEGFGRVMIALGAAAVLLGGAIGGLWLAFIGWFLLVAAEGERRMAESSAALSGLTVGDVMVADPVTAPAEMSVDEFLETRFLHHRFTAYPVMRNGDVAGLISFRSALRVDPHERTHTTVADVAIPLPEVTILSPADPLETAVEKLAMATGTRALVTEGGESAGLLSVTDANRLIEAADRSLPGGTAPPTMGADEDRDRGVHRKDAGLPG
jgi:Zn-dependent protease/CBS domain-containing protein